MKKITVCLSIIFCLFLLSSCTTTAWEEFPTSYITSTGVSIDYGDNNNYRLYVDINIPNEVFQVVEGYQVVIQIEVYLNISYYDIYALHYKVIEDVPFNIDIYEPGNNRYVFDFEFSSYLNNENFKGRINTIVVDSAFFRVSAVPSDLEVGEGLQHQEILLIGVSMMIAFVCYILTATILGIIVNRKLSGKIKVKKSTKMTYDEKDEYLYRNDEW